MGTLSKEWSRLKSLDAERKGAILILLVVLFVIGIFIGIAFFGKMTPTVRLPFAKPNTPTPTPQKLLSTLRLTPATGILRIGETVTFKVDVSGAPAQVIDAVLIYDPSIFMVKSVEKGLSFPLLLRQTNESGKLSVSASVDPKTPSVAALGEVFTFTFETFKASPSAAIDFDPALTEVARAGESILGSAIGGRYTVQ